ncbi:CDC27 family protein [Rubinisphaera margarita]|uniref:CDC27 family protein n=1 Tax=Rubinisphaera margarita TaxID=2909586 RepID=UPI001EE848AF|nr:CDC27 family protein [Rubinisphaera margarita]MCG6155907.1 CDC27 family protein [Rubinisphaera margarita]
MSPQLIAAPEEKPLVQTNTPLELPRRPRDVSDLLIQVGVLLRDNQPARALELITRSKLTSPSARNAMAVCQLRLGNPHTAIRIYRSLLVTGDIYFLEDAPALFKVNFALALLMNENVPGYQKTMAGLKDDDHPYVKTVRSAVESWRSRLNLWQRVQWFFGLPPQRVIDLGIPPGELE